MDLFFELKSLPGKSLYRCVADQISHFISVGRLRAGESLPPTRELARTLGTSRKTVVRAYNMLVSRGHCQVSSTRGTFVAGKNVPLHRPDLSRQATYLLSGQLSDYTHRLLQEKRLHISSSSSPQLNFGASLPQLLPVRKWRKILLDHSSARTKLVYQPDSFGHPDLRLAIVEYLRRAKGITCSFEQVIVFSQTQNAMNILCRVLLNDGDRLVVEEPGFGGIKNIALSQNLEIVPVALDDQGIKVTEPSMLSGSTKAIYVTPAHQDPTGLTMSMERRKTLLDSACNKNIWIIEDDFDSDFSYGGKPLPPMAALDEHGNVIYMSSFWKSLYPLTAIGFLVIPPSLIPAFRLAKLVCEPNSEALEHMVLADFISAGHLEQHLQKLRRLYTKQRTALLFHLKQALKGSIEISKHCGGTNQLIRLEVPLTERQILECASLSGLGLESTRSFYLELPQKKEFLVSFTGIGIDSSAEVVRRFTRALATVKK